MLSTHEILTSLKHVLEILRGGDNTPLTHPINTPASRAYYALSALYASILLKSEKRAFSGGE
jgi:hypothetical protein